MRISSGVAGGGSLIAVAGAAGGAAGVKYASPQAAFEQGLGAYKSGYYEIAIPALEEAAAKGRELNRFFAEFYLARIYSDNAGAQTDHAKAYMLFRKLADENADVDPDDGQRAPFVAKALTALAGYLRTGVKEIGVRAQSASAPSTICITRRTFFGDKDAQFELAKLYLSGDGTGEDVKRGMHYLSVLTEESYPGAQALLAELFGAAATSRRTSGARWRSSPWRSRTRRRTSASGSRTSTRTSSAAPRRAPASRPTASSPGGARCSPARRRTGRRMGLGGASCSRSAHAATARCVDIRRDAPAARRRVAAAPPRRAPPRSDAGQRRGFGLRDVGREVSADRSSAGSESMR